MGGTSKRNAKMKAVIDAKRTAKKNYKPSKAQPFKVDVKSKKSINANRTLTADEKAGKHLRTGSTIKRLRMYAKKVSAKDEKERRKEPNVQIAIEPNRKWFTNTRTITSTKLDEFRTVLENAREDPYSVLLKKSKVPTGLFDHSKEVADKKHSRLLAFQPYDNVMGKKAKRNKAQMSAGSYAELVECAKTKVETYDSEKDKQLIEHEDQQKMSPLQPVMRKGTSKRIWQELYKVVDSSDIIVYVVDARDPMGTRCRALETYIRKDKPHKHQIIILNKVDLVPNSVTEKWIRLIAKEYPTIGFCSNMKKGFGRFTFINLLRQYAKLMKDRRHVSVGFIGYPNVGKSSVINALRNKLVCKVAPVPGETKVWQYISLTNTVHLIDCPGVVPSDPNDEVSLVLKGVVRAEKLEVPEAFIPAILERVEESTLRKRYRIPLGAKWKDATEFIEILGIKLGKLKKGGEVETSSVSKYVLYDWQRGRLAYFVLPPGMKRNDVGDDMTDDMTEQAEDACTVGAEL